MNATHRLTGRPLSRSFVSSGNQFGGPSSLPSFTASLLLNTTRLYSVPPPTMWRVQDSPRTPALSVHHGHTDTAPTVSGLAHPEATRPSAESAQPNPGSAHLPRL